MEVEEIMMETSCPVFYYPMYSRICDSIGAGLLLSYLVRTKDKDDNLLSEDDEWICKQLYMDISEIKKYRNILRRHGFITYSDGLYVVNIREIGEALINL